MLWKQVFSSRAWSNVSVDHHIGTSDQLIVDGALRRTARKKRWICACSSPLRDGVILKLCCCYTRVMWISIVIEVRLTKQCTCKKWLFWIFQNTCFSCISRPSTAHKSLNVDTILHILYEYLSCPNGLADMPVQGSKPQNPKFSRRRGWSIRKRGLRLRS